MFCVNVMSYKGDVMLEMFIILNCLPWMLN
jgi:hypothetical protein